MAIGAERIASNHREPATNHLLFGWRLWAAWIVLGAVTILSFSVAVLDIRQFFLWWRPGSPLYFDILQAKYSPWIFFPVELILGIVQLAAWSALAVFIASQRPKDWMVLLACMMLFSVGYFQTTFNKFMLLGSIPRYQENLAWLLDIVSFGTVLLFYGTFPNGRFIPRWLWPAFAASFAFIAIQDLSIALNSQLTFFSIASLLIRFIFITGISLYAQIYRYRQANTVQRQQTKFVLYALCLSMVAMLIDKLLLRSMGQTGFLILRLIIFFFHTSAAVCFTFAILRHHLWDIDFVISRSLIYGGITIVLGAIFGGGFFVFRWMLEALLGSQNDLIAVAIPAAVITALFSPVRKWLRQAVDRYFYGIKLDYKSAVYEQASKTQAASPAGKDYTGFGRYINLELLGRGGMGEVYHATDPDRNCSVAIKILPHYLASDETLLRRFYREAQAIARLSHPNIVKVYDYGDQDGQPYIVLEFVDGCTLSSLLEERGRLNLEEALPILLGVASALDHAHNCGIVHRDIKPSNVMVELTGDGKKIARAVLMDFGIARLYTSVTQITETGRLIGTLDYVSPEQIQGASDVDHRTDIYSFGVMSYQIFTGKLPYRQKNPGALMMAHLMQPVPDPRLLIPDLPDAAAGAIRRAMAKEPEMRQKSAGELVSEITGYSFSTSTKGP